MSSMLPAEHEFLEALRRVLSRIDPRVSDIAGLTRLSAGATNETWSFDAIADGRVIPLIMRRAGSPRDRGGVLPLSVEANILTVAHRAGVPTPAIRCVFTPDDQLGEGFLMERIAGATIPSKILRDPELAGGRERHADRAGALQLVGSGRQSALGNYVRRHARVVSQRARSKHRAR